MKRKEFMSVPFDIKEFDDAERILTGYSATWDLDSGGDVIHKGAFKKTLKERVAAGKVKLADSHFWDSSHVLGTMIEGSEDDKGLLSRFKLSQAPSVDDTVTKIREKHINSLSIGYRAMKYDFEKSVDGSLIRHLHEVSLYEVSVTPYPMNEAATITGLKAMQELFQGIKDGTIDPAALETEELSAQVKSAVMRLWNVLEEKDREDLRAFLLKCAESNSPALPGAEEPLSPSMLSLRAKALESELRLRRQ